MECLIRELLGKKVYVITMGAHYLGVLNDADLFYIKLLKSSWLANPDPGSTDNTKKSRQYILEHGLSKNADAMKYPDPNFIRQDKIESITEWRHDLP